MTEFKITRGRNVWLVAIMVIGYLTAIIIAPFFNSLTNKTDVIVKGN